MNTLVIQSAKAAVELFKNHNTNFCDRKSLDVFTCYNYNEASVVVGQFYPYWNLLRHLFSVELMTNKRINETAHIRRKCMKKKITSVEIVHVIDKEITL